MKISIIGSGVYGCATAKMLNNAGNTVFVWTEKTDTSLVDLPRDIVVSNDYKTCLDDAELVYVLTSAIYTPSIFKNIKDLIKENMIVILGSKGILGDGMLIEDAFKREMPNMTYAIISGPTFAKDIGALEPLGFTIAAKNEKDFQKIARAYKDIKLEYTSDTTGVELCGVLKNAYAIGSGMLSGFNYGDSIRALYITMVIREMMDIFRQYGLREETACTLAGLGDTLMTCTSPNSRNFTFGVHIATKSKEEVLEYLKNTTVEGYENIKILHKLFLSKNIEAPLLSMLYEIIVNGVDAKSIIPVLVK